MVFLIEQTCEWRITEQFKVSFFFFDQPVGHIIEWINENIETVGCIGFNFGDTRRNKFEIGFEILKSQNDVEKTEVCILHVAMKSGIGDQV